MYQRKFHNQEIMMFSEDYPRLAPCDYKESVFIPFNYALNIDSSFRFSYSCHFFIDDYQFERLWNNPRAYIDILKSFKYVLQPDFSLFTDIPIAISQYNHFRKQWLGAYYQLNGVNVIPTLCWSDMRSFGFCLEGVPRHSVVAVSTKGCMKSDRKLFIEGFNKAMSILEPSLVLWFGEKLDVDFERIEYPRDMNSMRLKYVRSKYGRKRVKQ